MDGFGWLSVSEYAPIAALPRWKGGGRVRSALRAVSTCPWLSRSLPSVAVFCFLLSELEVLEQLPF